MPFDEAKNNCGLFVANCIRAMTGVDLAYRYRGRFSSLREGLALIREDGYDDLCDLLAARLEEIPAVKAVNGDVMAFSNNLTGWAIGICNGEMVTVLREDGLGVIRRSVAIRAFRVPA